MTGFCGQCPRCGYPYPKTLNIRVIGDGSAGQRHARMLRERGHVCQVVGPDFQHMGSPRPDAVVIASPPETHEQYLRLYWDICPILCEGPVTWLPRTAEPAPFPHMTASNWVFVPQIKRLKALIEGGECGLKLKPVSAHLWFDYDLAQWRGPGWAYKDSCYYTSGIDLINCHEAMTALWLFGPAEEVHWVSAHTGKSKGVDNIDVIILHKSGMNTTIHSGWHAAHYHRGIRVVFKDGTVEELGWNSPADDNICNQSYADMLDHWLKAIAENDCNVRPSLLDGYRAYKLMQGEAV